MNFTYDSITDIVNSEISSESVNITISDNSDDHCCNLVDIRYEDSDDISSHIDNILFQKKPVQNSSNGTPYCIGTYDECCHK